jgi:calcineurin-like phosphoesterase family protein
MSSDIFVISDTHFFHKNILNFKDKDGNRIRPEFSTVKEMNEFMIDQWNSIVKPTDHIIHVGDVIFGNPEFYGSVLGKLNGIKTLIMGNHDYDASLFQPWFKNIKSVLTTRNYFEKELTFSHYPMIERSFVYESPALNIHGHIHADKLESNVHINVCVEHTKYKPIHIEDILDGIFK